MLNVFRRYRVVSVCILIFACVLGWRVNEWFMALKLPTTEQAGYAAATLALVFGVANAWKKTKANDGESS